MEHLYEPNGFLSFASALLNPGGYLIILTGNPQSFSARLSGGKWWYFNYPEHVIFPSPDFFKSINDFELKSHLKVYASKEHEKGNFLGKLKGSIKNILARTYSGQPVIQPDHQLVVLQKREGANFD
jgi:hypothetical protein